MTFAGNALKNGRDGYGPKKTPLFVDGGLSALTGYPQYKKAGGDATRYALANLQEDGFLAWGGHMAYTASDDVSVYAEDKSKVHELKTHYPFYELMWEIDPKATRKLIETMWNGTSSIGRFSTSTATAHPGHKACFGKTSTKAARFSSGARA